MTCEKTRNVIYLVTSCFIIVIQGQGIVRDCTSSEIAKCSEIVNFTLLERTNYTITSAFCGDDYFRFKSCMEPLRDLCSAVILQLLDDLISTLMFVCHPQQLILLKNSTACLTSPAVTSHLAQCQKAFKDGIANSNSVGDICQKMVEFLSCSRWSAWASCGRLAAEYVYRLESHWVNKTIGTLGCTTTSREAPSGLLWSYVMQGYTIWNPSTSSIMQLNGDPETWVPEFLRSGNFSRRYIGSKRMARFGHLAADYWHNKLIWVDMTGSTAHYVPIYFFERESIPNTLVFGGMSKNVTAIAVDWVSENLYWADAGYQWIGLVPYKVGHMGHHVILFDEDLLHPSGIITDPAKGSLYWTDMDKGVIERSTLSGHQRRVLYSELSLPTSLAIDYNTSYLYWLGGYRHVIYSAHTDGGAITEVRSEGLTVVYNDLSVYEDYIFVTVNKADLIIYNKINGTKLNKIGVETNRNYEETYAVTVSAPSKQQPINNRCYYDNGDCQQICITNVDPVNSVLCMCTVGYHLATDGKRCQSEPLQDNFIVVADSYGKDLYMISIDGSTVRAIPTAPDSVPQTVVYILENRTILWYDETSSSLKETAIKDFRTRIIHYFGSAVIRAIRYDRMKNKIYFSDARSGYIKYIFMKPYSPTEKILLQSDIPAAIVLDINQRIIYWTEWRDMFSSPGIYSADMDTGLNKKLLVSTDLYYPSGLNVNFKDKKMFWCDAYTDKIEQYDMMNSERVTLVNKTGATFYSMTMEDDLYLYITDLSSRTLLRYDLQTSTFDVFGPKIFQKAVSLTLYRSSSEGQENQSTVMTSPSSQSSGITSRIQETYKSSSPTTPAASFPAISASSSQHTVPSSPLPAATTQSGSASSSSSLSVSSTSSAAKSSSPLEHSSSTSASTLSRFSTSSATRMTSSASASTSLSVSTSSVINTEVMNKSRRANSTDGATNQPKASRVSTEQRLSNGGKAAIIISVIIIVALIITILIVIYKRKGHIGHFFLGRMFSRRRMEELDDVVDVRMEDTVRDIDV